MITPGPEITILLFISIFEYSWYKHTQNKTFDGKIRDLAVFFGIFSLYCDPVHIGAEKLKEQILYVISSHHQNRSVTFYLYLS